MNAIYIELVEDSLTEFVYPAQLGGLQYELSALNYGIQLTVHGFNHKIQQLLDKVLDRMVNIKIEKQSFEIIKEKVKRSLQNFRREVPYQMAHFGVTYLTAEHQWNKDELLSCIDGITVHDVEAFIPRMLTRFFTDSLMYGNLTKDQALEYMTSVERKFQEKRYYQPLFPSMWFSQRELILPEGCNYAYSMLNDAHKLHAIEIYLQCFPQTLENNALLELFCHLVDEPCFDQLRTKEQLGYVVSAGARRSRGVQGFRVIVQSARELDHVNQRIELFIESIRDYILTMSDEQFKKQREGYMVKKLEVPKKMRSQGNKFWTEITNHQFCFDRSQLEVEIIQNLERNDLIRFYDHYISLNSIHRRKLALHVNPSSLALQKPNGETNNVEQEYETTATDEIETEQVEVTIPTGAIHEEIKLIEQPVIIEKLNETTTQEAEYVLPKKELNLPQAEWIDNIHVWKSKLSCYPLAQPYDKIDVPVLCKL
ncbi:unnamed protein product [Rotaria socialis]|uniref:Insulin-degrading enzyme n=1 Tax=Rotaria socialis TaxID=392032 RepID=A0A817REL4_9BILA|nr:unnamed protein product [Rotaria socialis]CAF4351552.1 unnamed protein product [Rotaria socialis]